MGKRKPERRKDGISVSTMATTWLRVEMDTSRPMTTVHGM